MATLRLKCSTESYPQDFTDLDTGNLLAKIYNMWGGATLKAVCKVHKQCHVMVQLSWFADKLTADAALHRWIGSSRELDESRHWAAARTLVASNKPCKAAKK